MTKVQKLSKKDLFKLISDLISFKTVYPEPQEFDKCINYIKNYFQDSSVYIKEFEFNNSRSIVISTHNTTDLDVIFCGHIDVVHAPRDLFTVKYNGDFLYGRGVFDMKGQVALMMSIIKNFVSQNKNIKIALFLTSDEERGGFDGVNKLLNNQKYSCKIAIVPDGGPNFNLVEESKGVLQLKITTSGISSHSSEVWNGNNAIIKLFNIFNKISDKFPAPTNHLDWKTSVNLAKIEGGDSLNKVPGMASMYLDIRHIYLDNNKDIIDFIKNFDSSLDIQILATGHTFKTCTNNVYVKKYLEICKSVLNKKIEIIKFHGASDGRFFTEKNMPCIIMNPEGGNFHCDDEWVNLESIYKLGLIYENFLQKIEF
ncbi:M20/M25/M40 family metallo-hydrolase [Candidatus Babeliales bacterium]|nr:M20/M25/M40 family metallo-hydrolase [Candidatus Babeliales bacterium]